MGHHESHYVQRGEGEKGIYQSQQNAFKRIFQSKLIKLRKVYRKNKKRKCTQSTDRVRERESMDGVYK